MSDVSNLVISHGTPQVLSIVPERLRNPKTPWTVQFVGEDAYDAGGPFRESLSFVWDEITRLAVPLLMDSPNETPENPATDVLGHNPIINPASASLNHLNMYKFVGISMAAAITQRTPVNLGLSPIVWKKILGTPLVASDLEFVDSSFYAQMKYLQGCEDESALEDLELYPFFVGKNSANVEVALSYDGSKTNVNLQNIQQYCDKYLEMRLTEDWRQVQMIREGIHRILPIQSLAIFTPSEVECMITGEVQIDIQRIKANTTYRGYTETEPPVQQLWRVVETFDHKDRVLFLRFVTGMSRLPREEFPRKFEVTKLMRSGTVLPQASTCFFQLKWPPYRSDDIARTRLLYAIHNCSDMDNDNAGF